MSRDRPSKKVKMSSQNSSNNTAEAVPAVASSASSESVAVGDAEQLMTCPACGRHVPAANIVLHEANCCRARSSVQQQSPSREEPSEHQQSTQQQQEQQAASSEIELPARERGQQTLHRWLSTSSPSNERGAMSSSSGMMNASNNSSNNSSSGTSSAPVEDGSNNTTSATETATNGSANEAVGTATVVGNIRPPHTQSTNTQTEASSAPAGNAASSTAATATEDNGNVEVGPNQWQCPRCTLVNENTQSNCDACLAPRNGRPPDSPTTERLVENGWVNVTYNPQFQRGRNGITRIQQNGNGNTFQFQNPMVHGGRLGTVTRVFNGLLNGAIVGSIFAGPAGMIVGGLAGAAGGAVVDRVRNREDANEVRQTREVANMLVNDDGGIAAGTVRVHRGNGYVTALASDTSGRNRVIRVRYDRPRATGSETQNAQQQYPAARSEVQQRENQELRHGNIGMREDLERSLLEILVQMSYSRDFGPGPGNNIILEPQETFEELIGRFGLGNDNRGASQDVIDSYPVDVVGEGDDSEDVGKKEEESSLGKKMDTDDTSKFGTCGICLEDYKEGESVKKLSCPHHPHSFHKDCIDKWLKLVASCPICKNDVGMYKSSLGENGSDNNGGDATLTEAG